MAETSVATVIKSSSNTATESYQKSESGLLFPNSVCGPFSRELKTRVHTELQSQNDNLTWSKETVQIKERYAVETGSCDGSQGPVFLAPCRFLSLNRTILVYLQSYFHGV